MLEGMAEVKLSPAARAFRTVHALVAGAFLLAIGYVWWWALTRRRDGWLRVAVAALLTEGALVSVNRGDCPLGGLQERLGDPVPLFDLVLSPTAARRAVPASGRGGRGHAAALVPSPVPALTRSHFRARCSSGTASLGAPRARMWIVGRFESARAARGAGAD